MTSKKASDIMTTVVVTLTPETRLTDAIKVFLRYSVSGIPVVDDKENLIGIITEHDIMNFAFSGNAAQTTVGEAMTHDVFTFTSDTDIESLVNCSAKHRVRRMPIVDGKRIVGIVSRRDILREMDDRYNQF